MQIISFVFFAFLGIVFFLQYLINKFIKDSTVSIRMTNVLLLCASYIFVLYADWRFAAVLFAITLTTYFCTVNIKLSSIGIIVALGSLAYFKYTNFFVESFVKLVGNDFTVINIILPIGISFYSFSAISYIIDVRRKKTERRNLCEVALYLSFFPKITSGPIQRSKDFFLQIEKKRDIGWKSFTVGIQIFIFGLFKKIVFADRLSVFVNQVYDSPSAFGSTTVFLAIISYSLQIYFDFSGYSDMAVGIAKILGINLPRNFNLPYISHNVTEFWKRWHITLSTWLKDYLYISLGGNRKGNIRTYVNLILTMVLGGIWHGANWTFFIWGLLHGFALVIHKKWISITNSDTNNHGLIANTISIITTFTFISFCWIFLGLIQSNRL